MTVDLTVIIATIKSRVDLFAGAIDSLFAQTVKPKEIIVIPDVGMKMPKGVMVIPAPAQGVYSRRNAAVRKATTKWIMYFDDDDLLRRDFIEKMWAGIVSDSYNYYYYEYMEYINAENNVTNRYKLQDFTDDIKTYIKRVLIEGVGRMPGAGSFINRGLFRGNSFRETSICCEDTHWLMRTAHSGLLKPKMIPGTEGYLVREVSRQFKHISRNNPAERAREFAEMRRDLSEGIILPPLRLRPIKQPKPKVQKRRR